MPRVRRASSGLWLLALLLCARGAVAAPPTQADVDLAKAHFTTGTLNYERGNFIDAAREFEEAYRLSGHSALLYNMGKSYDGAGDMRGALDAYRRFLAAVRTSPDRPFCERRVTELEALIARLEIDASVAGAVVTLDGTRLGTTPLPSKVIEINPGEHRLEIAAEGYATYKKTVRLERSQREQVNAQLVSLVKVIRVSETAVPVYKRWYLWTAVGLVVAAGVVTGAVLGARAANEIDGPSLQLPVVR